MLGSIIDWPSFVQRVSENVAPKGWVELQDFNLRYESEDGSLRESHSTYRWIKAIGDALARAGREPMVGENLAGWLREAGFVGVTEEVFTFPIGGWSDDARLRKIGLLSFVAILDGLEAFSLRLLCDAAGWNEADVYALLAEVHDEFTSGKFHAQIKL